MTVPFEMDILFLTFSYLFILSKSAKIMTGSNTIPKIISDNIALTPFRIKRSACLFFVEYDADNREHRADQAPPRPDVKVGIAARIGKTEQCGQTKQYNQCNVAALTNALSCRDRNDATSQHKNRNHRTCASTHLTVGFQCVVSAGRAGLKQHKDAQHNR